AWAHRLRLTSYSGSQLQSFLDQFLGKGPITAPTPEIEAFRDEGHTHVAQGTAITYENDPPTSGPHYPTPLANGFYSTPQLAGNIVHALEHSNIVIYYDPARITPADLDKL